MHPNGLDSQRWADSAWASLLIFKAWILVSFSLSSIFHSYFIICNFTYNFTGCMSINFLNLHARLSILYCNVLFIFTLKAVQFPWPLSMVKDGFIWICSGVFQIFSLKIFSLICYICTIFSSLSTSHSLPFLMLKIPWT